MVSRWNKEDLRRSFFGREQLRGLVCEIQFPLEEQWISSIFTPEDVVGVVTRILSL